MRKRYSICNIVTLTATICLFNSSASAHEKVVVVPLGGTVGNATAADVVKGRTFSSKSAGKGVTGNLERHPMGQVFVTPWYLLTFNLLPAGTFTMGSPADEPGRQSDEGPQKETSFSQPLYMMVNEVAQWQWAAVVDWGVFWGHLADGELNRDPSSNKDGSFPVTNVSYIDVQTWLGALNLLDSRLNCNGTLPEACYRLPTEAEWEYGARAGTTTAYANQYGFDAGDTETGGGLNSNLAAMGWYEWNRTNHDYGDGIKPILRKQANSWGLYDMHGNAWEWCRDWYQLDYYSDMQRPGTDPEGPAAGSYRVVRGGGWRSDADLARSASRDGGWPVLRGDYLGFRLVLPSGQ